MSERWQDGPVSVLIGDVLAGLAELSDGVMQCCVTSPPYWGLRDYGIAGQLGLEATPEEYVSRIVAVFREVRRVLRKDGTLWLNLGDSYATGTSADRHSPSTLNFGAGTLAARDVDRNGNPFGLAAKNLIGIPWRVAFALQADGWYLRLDIIWSKPNPMPESVTDRPTKAHEYLFLMSKSARYYYDADAIREPVWGEPNSPGSIRSPYGQGFTRRSNNFVRGDHRLTHAEGDKRYEASDSTRNKRSVWEIATQPYPEAHFATFPEALVEPCIKAGSREGDMVLDPFAGSGTTLAVARRLGRRAVGIELQPKYLPLIQHRVRGSALPLIEAIEEAS